jgi:hypothetical protein
MHITIFRQLLITQAMDLIYMENPCFSAFLIAIVGPACADVVLA